MDTKDGKIVIWDAKFCYKKKADQPMKMTITLMDRDTFTKDDKMDSVTIDVPQEDTTMDIEKDKFDERSGAVKITFFTSGKYGILVTELKGTP